MFDNEHFFQAIGRNVFWAFLILGIKIFPQRIFWLPLIRPFARFLYDRIQVVKLYLQSSVLCLPLVFVLAPGSLSTYLAAEMILDRQPKLFNSKGSLSKLKSWVKFRSG